MHIIASVISKSGITPPSWSLNNIAASQLINGVVGYSYQYINPGTGIQYLSIFGTNTYASQTFHAPSVGVYKLSFDYASSISYPPIPLRMSINGSILSQKDLNHSRTWINFLLILLLTHQLIKD